MENMETQLRIIPPADQGILSIYTSTPRSHWLRAAPESKFPRTSIESATFTWAMQPPIVPDSLLCRTDTLLGELAGAF